MGAGAEVVSMDFGCGLDAARSFHLSLAGMAGNQRLYSILETPVEAAQRLTNCFASA